MSNFYFEWFHESKFSFFSVHSMVFVWIFLIFIVPIFMDLKPPVYTMEDKKKFCITQEQPKFLIIEAYDPIVKDECIDVVNMYLFAGAKIVDTTSDRRGDIYSYVLEK